MATIGHTDVQQAINEAGARWMAGPTSLSDLTDAERRSRLGVIDRTEAQARGASLVAGAEAAPGASWPQRFDWRDQNKVTAIRDQGNCGSCVSFGSIAALECKILIEDGFPLDLSEGDLHFCSSHGANCDGWWPDQALEQLHTRGVCDEACAPYVPGSCNTCADRGTRVVTTAGQHYWQSPDTMRVHLSTVGPLLACFDVFEDFYHYTCGVYGHLNGGYEGGHCVAVIGYDDVQKAWICKNSWNTSWGANGYFMIGYGQCGIDKGMWEIDSPISVPWSLRPKDQKDNKDSKDNKDKDKDNKDSKDRKDNKEDDKLSPGREKLVAKEKDRDSFDPVRYQLAQMAVRVEEIAHGLDTLSAAVAEAAAGRAFINPAERPEVGSQILSDESDPVPKTNDGS